MHLISLLKLKNFFKFLPIGIVLIFSINFFQSTPIEKEFFQLQAVFLGVMIIYMLFFIVNSIVKHNKIDNIVKYFILLLFLVPTYSALRAYMEFDQPIIYGMLAQRGWAVIAAGIYLYYLIMTKDSILKIIELTFILFAWISLLYFTYLYFTFDVTTLDPDSKFARMTLDRGLRIKFNEYFITFGIIYYFIKFNVLKKVRYLVFFMLFLAFAVLIIEGRTYIIEVFFTLILFVYRDSKFQTFLFKSILYFVALLLLLLLLYILKPEFIDTMVHLFMQMFIVLSGKISEDPSSNARIFESAIVLNYFDLNPHAIIFGIGRLSNQWNDGYESIFGYFFPSDIGLLGGLFQYGIIGILLLWLVPLKFSYQLVNKSYDQRKNIFIVTMQYLLIYYMVRSINTGNYLLFIHEYLIIFFILLGCKKKVMKEKAKCN